MGPETMVLLLHSLYYSMHAGNSGVVVQELTFRKQEFNFTLEDTVGGSGEESVVILQRDFRLGKYSQFMLTYCCRPLHEIRM